MSNLFEEGAAMMASAFRQSGSIDATYCRGLRRFATLVVKGRSDRIILDGEVGGVSAHELDFLLAEEDARFGVFGDGVEEPIAGDRILEHDAASDATRTWEVMPIPGEPCWRWSDDYYKRRRIHVKLVSEV